MTKSDDERYRKRKEREREMEKKQRKTGRDASKMDDRYSGTTGQYKKERAKKHGVDSKSTYTSPEAEASTRQYQRDNREADRLDRIRETERAEERNRLMQRSERRHERKDGLDRQGHERLADRTQDIAGLDVDAAGARRKSLYDRDDRRGESYNHPDFSSRNLHGRHARTAEEEAGRSTRVARDHVEYAHEPSTPSSRDRYPRVAEDGDRHRVALPPQRDGRDDRERGERSHYSSPLSIDPRNVSSMSSSHNRDTRVNLAPPPPSNWRPFIPESERPPTSMSTSMTGGSGQRHSRNPASWSTSRPDDVSSLANRVAAMDMSDSDEDRSRRLRRARDGKKK